MKPKLQSKDQLISALRDILARVESDDSFEGSIEYTATGGRQFEVMAFWRVGNSEGQGGSVMIGSFDA